MTAVAPSVQPRESIALDAYCSLAGGTIVEAATLRLERTIAQHRTFGDAALRRRGVS